MINCENIIKEITILKSELSDKCVIIKSKHLYKIVDIVEAIRRCSGQGIIPDDAVLYMEQNKSELEKLIARNNINAASLNDLIPGKSAYEIALENDFIGTEQEWLNSLKGETGEFGLISFYINENMELISVSTEVSKFNFELNNNKELIIV